MAHARKLAAALVLTGLVVGSVSAFVSATDISFYAFGGQSRRDAVENFVIPTFEAQHPDINVEVIWGTLEPDQLKTLIAGGAAPDIAYVRLEYFRDLVLGGAYAPLDPFVTASSFDLANIPEVALDLFTHQGRLYALPFDSSPFNVTAMYVNNDLFTASGLAVPVVDYEDPYSGWTYDDLRDMAIKLTQDRDGDGQPEQWGFWSAYGFSGNAFRLIWNFGGDVLQETPSGWRANVDSPEVVEAVEFIHELRWVDNAVGGSFPNGTRAIHLAALGFMSNLVDGGVPFDWTLVSTPRGAGGRWNLAHVNPMGILATSAHKEEAFAFIAHWLSDEVQFYMTDRSALPAQTYNAARRREYVFRETPPYDMSPFFFGRSRAMPVWSPGWVEIERLFTQTVQPIWNQPNHLVANELANLQQQLEAALSAAE